MLTQIKNKNVFVENEKELTPPVTTVHSLLWLTLLVSTINKKKKNNRDCWRIVGSKVRV